MPWRLTGGSETVEFTSMLNFDVTDSSSVVSGKIEKGSFANYNKTDAPLTIKVTLAVQGDDSVRQSALSALRRLKNSLDLVQLETPEAYYDSLNVQKYSYLCSAETGPLVVNLELVEIRQVDAGGTTRYSAGNCQNPTSCDTVDTGTR